MLSLPLITPRPDSTLWPSHRLSNPTFDTSSTDHQNQSHSNGHRRQDSGQGHYNHSSRSLLASLAADENVIHQRKQNVRRFGAGWIRPPGVAKTYQATMDEAAEREEQEIIARREQVLMDLAAAQDAVAARQQAEQGEDDEIGEGEHDLDDDVPEAEESFSEVSNDSEDDIVTEEGDTVEENSQIEAADLTFNDESFIEGSMVQAEVEHMLEMEEAEMAGVLQEERDLDDDIPEAGSYEHTDTELTEDLSSSEPEEDSFAHRASTGRRRSRRRSSGVRPQRSSGVGPQHRGGRSSITNEQNSSIMDSSSFLRSSPAAARGADIASTFRSRFMGSRAPRGS